MPSRPFSIILFFLFFICLQSRAQVKWGVEAGPDFPRLLNILQGYNASGGTVSENSSSVTRFQGGIFADFTLDRKQEIILRPHVRYTGAGGETPQILDFNGNEIQAKTKYKFGYVDLPVQLLYSPNLSFGKPWVGGGFYGGIMESATATTNQGTGNLNIGNGDGGQVKRFDFGFTFTAGFTFKAGVLIGVDFQQSIPGITPASISSGSSPSIRNSIWGIHIGYEAVL